MNFAQQAEMDECCAPSAELDFKVNLYLSHDHKMKKKGKICFGETNIVHVCVRGHRAIHRDGICSFQRGWISETQGWRDLECIFGSSEKKYRADAFKVAAGVLTITTGCSSELSPANEALVGFENTSGLF